MQAPANDSNCVITHFQRQKMSFDDILRQLGEFGRYQQRVYIFLCFTAISCAMHELAGVFLNSEPQYRCRMPYENEASSYFQNKSITNLTRVSNDFSGTWSKCQRVDANFTDEYFSNGIKATGVTPCEEWIFDESIPTSSTVIDFHLVCNRAWLTATADSLLMLGVLIGSYAFGYMSDRYGRRPTFMIALICQLTAGIIIACAPEYITFAAGRLITGASLSGVYLTAYVLGMEMVGASMRQITGSVFHMFFSFGYFIISIMAYLTRNYSWRVLQITLTLIPGVFFLPYRWIIPESSRWLAARGRRDEAKEILHNVAKENGVNLPEAVVDNIIDSEKRAAEENSEQNKSQPSVLDLMKHKNLRRRSFIVCFCWLVTCMVYFGLSWSTSDLGWNVYATFCLSGAMEFPGYGILMLTLNRYGRKFSLCGALLVSGSVLLLTAVVPNKMNWLTITLAMIGKFAITASYGAVYIFTIELFPTVLRNTALGAASMSAHIGGMLVPYLNQLVDVWRHLPLLIFGGLAFVAGGLALKLPETLNRTLAETIEEEEN